MLGFLQRRLIYRPTRQNKVCAENAGLPVEMVTPVQIPTHDNLLLNGWHVSADMNSCAVVDAKNEESRNSRGLVIHFPGNARNRAFRGVNCLTLAELGVDVLLVDYRGYGENPGAPREEHIACDARAIRNFAVEQLGFPLSKTVIYGESLGGGVATRLAAETCAEGTFPAGLILSSTFPSLADAGLSLYPWLPVRRFLVERYRSIDHISRVASPLLVVHGREDEILPIELGRSLFNAAPARSQCGIAKRFVEISAGHNNVYRVARIELQQAIKQFLDEIWEREQVDSQVAGPREHQLEITPS
jgi:pimeloyl-ACP methyl ester carboxylesterase